MHMCRGEDRRRGFRSLTLRGRYCRALKKIQTTTGCSSVEVVNVYSYFYGHVLETEKAVGFTTESAHTKEQKGNFF